MVGDAQHGVVRGQRGPHPVHHVRGGLDPGARRTRPAWPGVTDPAGLVPADERPAPPGELPGPDWTTATAVTAAATAAAAALAASSGPRAGPAAGSGGRAGRAPPAPR